MKNILSGTIFLFLLLSFTRVSAQTKPPLQEPDYNKPKLFSDVASKFAVDVNALETLLELGIGAQVNAPLTRGFNLAGTVVSKSDPTDISVKSVVISSSNRHGATMTFTRTHNEDGSYNYIGRILSYKNSDAFEIVKADGQYFLEKKNLYDLLSE
jgi:hypothetical protein